MMLFMQCFANMCSLLPLLEALPDFSGDNVKNVVAEYVEKKGIKNGVALWPLRTAVSGKQMTPGGATELMEVLGKDETVARIKAAIELLSK